MVISGFTWPPCSQVSVSAASKSPILKLMVFPVKLASPEMTRMATPSETSPDPTSLPSIQAVTTVPLAAGAPSTLAVTAERWGGICWPKATAGKISSSAATAIRANNLTLVIGLLLGSDVRHVRPPLGRPHVNLLD
ncbi:MAG: hypothetical protein BZY88_11455 [SAR202 cluster bacterium Io17-Chloro-G9]|nr:MAG: hypothetical protein BZY88_11455 [SAR202 cluster bacterium Io17-Chloro-G9]